MVQGSRQAQILQEEAVRQMEIRRRMRAEVVPTQDGDVRRMLRQLEHPVTLFGEREVWFAFSAAASELQVLLDV